MQTKVCNTCSQEKPFSEFNKDKTVSDGFARRCRQCSKTFFAKYRNEHRDELNAYYRDYFKDNPDHAEDVHNWQVRNRDKRNAQFRNKLQDPNYKAHYGTRKEDWRSRNPEKVKQYSVISRLRHVVEHRIYENIRRKKAKENGGQFTKQDVLDQLARQHNKCYWCSKPLDQYHVDHIIPISRGGSNDPSNLVIACPSCNSSRGNKLPHEWDSPNRRLF